MKKKRAVFLGDFPKLRMNYLLQKKLEKMKTRKNYLLTIIVLLSISLTSFAQDKVIPEGKLPKEIRSYVKTHFPSNSILQASIDDELFSKSYELILSDNISLDFNSKNKITDIESKSKSKLPDSVIPKRILEYTKTNYPNNVIISWELDDRNQQIELDNGLDLEFNMAGDFLMIDD